MRPSFAGPASNTRSSSKIGDPGKFSSAPVDCSTSYRRVGTTIGAGSNVLSKKQNVDSEVPAEQETPLLIWQRVCISVLAAGCVPRCGSIFEVMNY